VGTVEAAGKNRVRILADRDVRPVLPVLSSLRTFDF
jgi:hypothetical protein